jgi:hypothetical protein
LIYTIPRETASNARWQWYKLTSAE